MRAEELPRAITLNTFINEPTIKNWPVAKDCTLERHSTIEGFEPKLDLNNGQKAVYIGVERTKKTTHPRYKTPEIIDVGVSLVFDPNQGEVKIVSVDRSDSSTYKQTVLEMEQEGWTVIPTDLNKVIGYRAKLKFHQS